MRRAFTLLEAGIVLLIAAMMILLGVFANRQTIERHREEEFYRQLQSGFSYVAMKASTKCSAGQVSFLVDDPQRIVFSCAGMTAPQRVTVRLPGTIRFNDRSDVTCRISEKGSLTPATVHFSSSLTKKSYRLTTQLGFGVQYRITPEKGGG